MQQVRIHNTINQEIFVVEKFSQLHKATKFNLTKYFLQWIFLSRIGSSWRRDMLPSWAVFSLRSASCHANAAAAMSTKQKSYYDTQEMEHGTCPTMSPSFIPQPCFRSWSLPSSRCSASSSLTTGIHNLWIYKYGGLWSHLHFQKSYRCCPGLPCCTAVKCTCVRMYTYIHL